jgi:hypothetical protein
LPGGRFAAFAKSGIKIREIRVSSNPKRFCNKKPRHAKIVSTVGYAISSTRLMASILQAEHHCSRKEILAGSFSFSVSEK